MLPAVGAARVRPPAEAEKRTGGFSKRYLTLFAGEVISKLCVFAAFAYLARVLGPSGFGLIELALSITMFFVMAVDGGLGSYGARVVSAQPDEAPRVLAQITAVRAVAAVIAYVPILLGSLFYGMPGAGMLAVYGLVVFVVPLFNQWLFQGFRAMHLVAAGTALRNVVFAAVVFAFVRPGVDLRVVAACGGRRRGRTRRCSPPSGCAVCCTSHPTGGDCLGRGGDVARSRGRSAPARSPGPRCGIRRESSWGRSPHRSRWRGWPGRFASCWRCTRSSGSTSSICCRP